MLRRKLLSLIPVAALVACEGGKLPALPVDVTLPPDLLKLVTNANNIYTKISGLGLGAGATGLLDKMRQAVAAIAGSKTVEMAKSYVADFAQVYDLIKPYLPAAGALVSTKSYITVGQVVKAIETVLPIMLKVAGLVSMFARTAPTGMSEAEAEAVLAG